MIIQIQSICLWFKFGQFKFVKTNSVVHYRITITKNLIPTKSDQIMTYVQIGHCPIQIGDLFVYDHARFR